MYDQETVRNNGQTSYSRLKSSVRMYIDQFLKETHVGSIMWYQLLATGANLVDNKNDRPLPHQIRRQPKTERENPNHLIKRIKALLTKGAEAQVSGKLFEFVVYLQTSSRVSEQHFRKKMQIWQKFSLPTC